MKNLVLIISVLLLVATFAKNASAQLEVGTNNKVMIGNPHFGDAMLTIQPQFGGPGHSNLLIGDAWSEGSAMISIGVDLNYAWIQSWNNKPLIINRDGGHILFCNRYCWDNVGIGEAIWSPSAKLQVNGNILATGTITSSDARLKKDIVKLTTNKNKNKNLEAKMYSMANNNPKYGITDLGNEKISKIERAFAERKHFGFLAQDVQKVYPELVYEDNDGYLSIDYQGFIPILFETVKEQQVQIDAQQATLDSQAKLISDLVKRVQALEKKN